MKNKILKWLEKALSDGKTGLPSIKRLGFFLVVCVLLSLAIGSLTGALLFVCLVDRSPENIRALVDALKSIAETAAYSASFAYAGGKAAEAFRGGSPDVPNPSPDSDEAR